ncbi:MAG: hypothetical protein KDB61_14990, partial [Planctomycetes bacterium]|nr:hypothetical protein [Planctomycetota bacterium]
MVSLNLDETVSEALAHWKERNLPAPHALLLLGTGLGPLAQSLSDVQRVPLHEIHGVPGAWQEVELVVGTVESPEGACCLWLLEDAPGPLQFGTGGGPERPAWERAFPVWLAAAAGARLLIHTSAGTALQDSHGLGSIAAVTDHINLSGGTPLLGLGPTQLGPLFPDQTQLHHAGLALVAEHRLAQLGAKLGRGIAACMQGPSGMTPAELDWLASTPAQLAIQNCAGPWIAAAHAGLSLLA